VACAKSATEQGLNPDLERRSQMREIQVRSEQSLIAKKGN
jgi:hypothetical protein